jgi:hypothetical protein
MKRWDGKDLAAARGGGKEAWRKMFRYVTGYREGLPHTRPRQGEGPHSGHQRENKSLTPVAHAYLGG